LTPEPIFEGIMSVPAISMFVERPVNLEQTILSFDPGETIGWAVTKNGFLKACGQLPSAEWTQAQVCAIERLFEEYGPDIVVYELYTVYGWKTDSHAWNEVHTAQIIGIIRFLCLSRGIPYAKQTAQIAKGFCTDDKLKAWGFIKGIPKHARDAIRHNLYWLMFGDMRKLWDEVGEHKTK